MRRKSFYLSVIMALALSVTLMSGCKNQQETDGFEDEYDVPQEDVSGDMSMEEDEDGYVSSVEELLESIAPETEIFLEAGYYNLSEYAESVWEQEGEAWNESHPYVQLSECSDGVEIIVQDVDGLYITGETGNPADTEIVTDAGDGAVLSFVNCNDIALESLAMGHAESGEASGNVLNFSLCNNVQLTAMELYGAGAYGIAAENGSGDMYIYDSIIRDCWVGSFYITAGIGSFEFADCSLIGSEGEGIYEGTDESDLCFYRCDFGQMETAGIYFREDIYTEDCTWSEEFEEDPDYEYEEGDEEYEEEYVEEDDSLEEFNTQSWPEVPVDVETLEYSYWMGYVMVDSQSGEIEYLPYENPGDGSVIDVAVELDEAGLGWIEYKGESYEVNWSCDGQYSIHLQSDSLTATASLHEEMYDGESTIWMMLQMDNKTFWLY